MTYLITGKNGQLAKAFIQRFEKDALPYHAPDESQLDITQNTVVSDIVSALKPSVIINCAAYNLVDKAELDRETVHAVNARGPYNLALAADKQGAFMVHFGSDYVFDGLKETDLYNEDDEEHPLNEYGLSKLQGERQVLSTNQRALVMRLSWVFGDGTQNFIYKLSDWSRKNAYLKIACDEFSVPTFTHTVVEVTLKAIEQGLTGKYHLTNSGYCSRYEWAKLILKELGIKKFIRPVTMDSFNLPAKRPKFSAMSNSLISERLNIAIPSWEDAVISFLQNNRTGKQ